jgi:hypothetical protein
MMCLFPYSWDWRLHEHPALSFYSASSLIPGLLLKTFPSPFPSPFSITSSPLSEKPSKMLYTPPSPPQKISKNPLSSLCRPISQASPNEEVHLLLGQAMWICKASTACSNLHLAAKLPCASRCRRVSLVFVRCVGEVLVVSCWKTAL